mmetsp:Transcript_10775/g.28816  ORF Transcript_10775/g.28816 Transcript_10775/m.28816 type:complete len:611 (+) Transcript_10775:238-2070(+)
MQRGSITALAHTGIGACTAEKLARPVPGGGLQRTHSFDPRSKRLRAAKLHPQQPAPGEEAEQEPAVHPQARAGKGHVEYVDRRAASRGLRGRRGRCCRRRRGGEVVVNLRRLPSALDASPRASPHVVELFGRVHAGALEVAGGQRVGSTPQLLVVAAEDPVGRPVRLRAPIRDLLAAERRGARAHPADGTPDDRRHRVAVGHALGLRAHLDPVGAVGELGDEGRVGPVAARGGLGVSLEARRVGDGGAEVLDDAVHEARHPRGTLLGHDLAVPGLAEGDLPRAGDAQVGVVNTSASVNLREGGGDVRAGGHVALLGREAVDVIGLAEVGHLRDEVAAEAEHAEVHLGAGLPVGDLELEERDAQEERTLPRNVQDRFEVLRLVREDAVVLPDVDGSRGERRLVIVQELGLEIRGGVLGVEAVRPPLAVGRRDVVLGIVAVLRGVLHRVVELPHLPQRRVVAELPAGLADRVREGRREVDEGPHDTRILLGVQHGVEGADDAFGHQHGALRGAGGGVGEVGELQVRLVDDVHDLERWVVLLRGGQEALLEVPGVQRLDLREAVVLRVYAPRAGQHLGVGPVAHAGEDHEVLRVGCVQEVCVVVLGVVAVEAH